jgi:hypothetical protein
LHLDAPHVATARSVEDRDVSRLRVRDEHVPAVVGASATMCEPF